jgi:predicted DNA-binding transcriptional regulator AlpA
MLETLVAETGDVFPGKAFLTVEDVKSLLSCTESTIYNWSRRADPQRRPPRLMVGKSIRFPKREFFKWLSTELKVEIPSHHITT